MADSPKRPRKSQLPKLIEKYYADLAALTDQRVLFEMGTRHAFHTLLAAAGKEHGYPACCDRNGENRLLIRMASSFHLLVSKRPFMSNPILTWIWTGRRSTD